MLDSIDRVRNFDDAVRAFLCLDADQIPEFCRVLGEKGIYVNVSISFVGVSPLVGVQQGTDDGG